MGSAFGELRGSVIWWGVVLWNDCDLRLLNARGLPIQTKAQTLHAKFSHRVHHHHHLRAAPHIDNATTHWQERLATHAGRHTTEGSHPQAPSSCEPAAHRQHWVVHSAKAQQGVVVRQLLSTNAKPRQQLKDSTSVQGKGRALQSIALAAALKKSYADQTTRRPPPCVTYAKAAACARHSRSQSTAPQRTSLGA